MAFTLTSTAFAHGERIPDRHARAGGNLSPPLEWTDPPAGTRSFALIVEDPDAPGGTFRHWAVYDLPADLRRLEQGAATSAFGRGFNDYDTDVYEGPHPPTGHGIHHYHFRLAALDAPSLEMPPDARVEDVWEMARRHLLDEARLTGIYQR